LTFGGKLFTITERDTILQPSPGVCLGVVTGGATEAIGKLGAPFLRNVYTFVPVFPYHRLWVASDPFFQTIRGGQIRGWDGSVQRRVRGEKPAPGSFLDPNRNHTTNNYPAIVNPRQCDE